MRLVETTVHDRGDIEDLMLSEISIVGENNSIHRGDAQKDSVVGTRMLFAIVSSISGGLVGLATAT